MSIKKTIANLVKRTVAGGAVGYVSSRSTSSSAEAGANSKMGGIVGAITAGISPLAGKVIFRRIRGRLIPIRVKK